MPDHELRLASPAKPRLTISIVSHGQIALVKLLLSDLAKLETRQFEVLVTINIPEDESAYREQPFPIHIIRNPTRKGFGANHNAAFEQSNGDYFAVLNPDIRISSLDLETLLEPFCKSRVGAVAPVILSPDGRIEDSARRFPTAWGLARRFLLAQRKPDYSWNDAPIEVDWAAGMFVLFRREAFQALNGFDDKRFFMYFEDVDICARLRQRGLSVVLQPRLSVVHDAQRASHRSMKHLRWHMVSAARYLWNF
ncbi:glycosyltransferase family 2 protein [Povalibacter sp.]|uniref:glycosyltransferase family 2 protein n=1 Tax=Povalibacter sp. TaxID=1962978 RepID=UPI002F3FDE6F